MKNEKNGGPVLKARPRVRVEGEQKTARVVNSALHLWETERAHIARRLAKLGVETEKDGGWDFSGWIGDQHLLEVA